MSGNNLLYLLNISHFSSLCCAQNSSLTSCPKTMAKRMQEQEGDKRIVAESMPTTMNLGLHCLDKFFDCEQSDCVEKSGDTQSTLSNRLVKYRDISGRKYRETCRDRRRNLGTEGNDEDWSHNLHISTNYVQHTEKVFSNVRQRFGLSPTHQMKNLDVNTAVRGIFMSVTFQAAVHLGMDYTENLRST